MNLLDPMGWSLKGEGLRNEVDNWTGERHMLVDGLIAEHSITMLYAEDGLGKSILALQLALEMAHGLPAFGHLEIPHRMNVIYYSTERPKDEPLERIAIMRQKEAYGFDFENICLTGQLQGYDISRDEDFNICLDIIHEEKQLHFGDNPIHAVFIDPVYSLFAGDLNSNKDVAHLRRFVTRLQNKFGCAVILTHHENRGQRNQKTGKREGQDVYGSRFLTAMSNSVFHIRKGQFGTIWTKEKDQYNCLYNPIPMRFNSEFYLSFLDMAHSPISIKTLVNKFINECHSKHKTFSRENIEEHLKSSEKEVSTSNLRKIMSRHLDTKKITNVNPKGHNALYKVLDKVDL